MTIASDDFYSYSARQRLQQINANRAQALADLEVAKANADYDAAGFFAVQQVADLEAQRQALVSWLSGLPAIAEYLAALKTRPVCAERPVAGRTYGAIALPRRITSQ